MKKPLISKIRCNSPNMKSKTAMRNYNYLYYIATREGVDLSPLEKELNKDFLNTSSSDDLYLKYIHERPKSNGLFGTCKVNNINELCNFIKDISTRTPIFRGIISLAEDDANKLGFTTKEKWKRFLEDSLPEIGEFLGVNYKDLEWVAAFHNEKSHPHVHYMLWSKVKEPIDPFISITTQNRCRELLSKKMFNEDFQFHKIEKTKFRDLLTDNVKEKLASTISEFTSINAGLKISNYTLDSISYDLIALLKELPDKGKLNYKYLNKDLKGKIDELVYKILQKKELNIEYNNYLNEAKEVARTYSPSEAKLKISLENARKDINVRLANIILKALKKLKDDEILYNKLMNYIKDNKLHTIEDIIDNIHDNDELDIPNETKEKRNSSNNLEKKITNSEKVSKSFIENQVKPITYSLFSDFFSAILETRNNHNFFNNYFSENSIDGEKKIMTEELIKLYGKVREDEIVR